MVLKRAMALSGLLCLVSLYYAQCARLPDGLMAEVSSDALPSNLQSPLNTAASILPGAGTDEVDKGDKDKQDDNTHHHHRAYATIRYIVPPSHAKGFEKAWLKMEKAARKYHGQHLHILDLKTTCLDNLLFMDYVEMADCGELMRHLHSSHFRKFMEEADDKGVKWRLQVLRNVSEDSDHCHHADQGGAVSGGEGEEGGDDVTALVDRLKADLAHKRKDKGRKDQDDFDWDKYVPDEYKPYIPDEYRPHKGKGKGGKGKGGKGKHKLMDYHHDCDCGEEGCDCEDCHCGCDDDNSHHHDDCDCGEKGCDCKDCHCDCDDHHHRGKGDEGEKHRVVPEVSLEALAEAGAATTTTEFELAALRGDLMARKGGFHVLVYYMMHPCEAEGWVHQWHTAAEATIHEKGNRVYSLRKVATDNTRFYVYGTWDNMKAYIKHMESDHMHNLLHYNNQHNIVYFVAPLHEVGGKEE